ncbi:MAG TPA: hypothetical protein VFM30_03835 [Steroidobacteraceae bacterium]|jgi:hypothetical protein|nr:hypothetical protein [Steroidobacteraceae bacterium]
MLFTWAIVLIAIGAVIGLYMAVNHFRGRTPPKAIHAVLHGVLVVGGAVLALLGVHDLGYGTLHTWALVLFGIAAAGGLFLASQHMSQVRLSNNVVVIHAVVAVAGFLTLLAAVFLMR